MYLFWRGMPQHPQQRLCWIDKEMAFLIFLLASGKMENVYLGADGFQTPSPDKDCHVTSRWKSNVSRCWNQPVSSETSLHAQNLYGGRSYLCLRISKDISFQCCSYQNIPKSTWSFLPYPMQQMIFNGSGTLPIFRSQNDLRWLQNETWGLRMKNATHLRTKTKFYKFGA